MENKKVIVVGAGLDKTTELAKILAEESVNAEVIQAPEEINFPKKEVVMKIENTHLVHKEYFKPPQTRQERRRKDRALKKKHNRKF